MVLRFLLKVFLYFTIFLIALPFLPVPLAFEPKAFVSTLPKFEGPLAQNTKLDDVEYLLKDVVYGPESMDVHNGFIYTGTIGGYIVRTTGSTRSTETVAKLGKKCGGRWEEEVCGRPLGLRFDKSGRLFVMDAYYGINVVDVKTGFVSPLVPGGVEVGNKPFLFGNDLVIDDTDGSIYFTETSGKWPLNKIVYSIMEHENSGRLLKYNPATKKVTVLLEDLYTPNGIELSYDNKSVLFSELTKKRVLRYHIKGEREGDLDVFADKLPGEVDNIRRSKSGGYWLAFACGRSRDSPIVADRLGEFPLVRKSLVRFLYLLGSALKYVTRYYDAPALKDVAAQLENAWVVYETLPKYGLIVEVNKNGEVVQSLHSPSGKISLISEVLEHDGYLYLGSFRNNYLGRIQTITSSARLLEFKVVCSRKRLLLLTTMILKAMLKAFLYLLLFFVALPFLPMQLDFEPQANTLTLPEFVGPLERNERLDNVEFLFKGQLKGPESLPVYKGSIYTGTEGGHIYKITGDKITLVTKLGKECEGIWEEEVCGRPLGMRFDKQGKLYVIDAYYGLHVVDVNKGTAQNLLPGGAEIEGKKLVFGDDLELGDDGAVYITDASNRWPLKKILYTVVEHENTGRVLRYDLKTKKTTVIMKDLHLPNGIQLSHDKQSLLVAELCMRRVLRYYLKGPKKGQTEVFVDNLPGEPDNIRPSKRGGYWVGFATARPRSAPHIGDLVAPLPIVKKATIRFLYLVGSALRQVIKLYPAAALKQLAAQFDNAWVLYDTYPKYGLVVELDAKGNIVQSLHSPSYKISMLSEVLEHDGYLYLGSYRNPFLGRVKL
ncbi:uncharacterized protein LOC135398717 [Ornithodoros turicata]|uniref:uncharacterized protein LOC135398717 n=1 Tax=Ornithodoros turicata TaxID=34597 RepID=UPI003139D9D5